jgi:hypothetical protein
MSLAHLQEMKSDRTRSTPGASTARRVALSGAAFCGASHEPVFRTMDDAAASGLEICDTCVLLFRRQKRAR